MNMSVIEYHMTVGVLSQSEAINVPSAIKCPVCNA